MQGIWQKRVSPVRDCVHQSPSLQSLVCFVKLGLVSKILEAFSNKSYLGVNLMKSARPFVSDEFHILCAGGEVTYSQFFPIGLLTFTALWFHSRSYHKKCDKIVQLLTRMMSLWRNIMPYKLHVLPSHDGTIVHRLLFSIVVSTTVS